MCCNLGILTERANLLRGKKGLALVDGFARLRRARMNTLELNYSPVNLPSPDRSRISSIIRQLGGLSAASRFTDCGEAGRGYVGYCPNGHEVYHSFGCMLRICPRCGSSASKKLSEKLVPAIQNVVRGSSAALSLKHIVLTTNISLVDYMKEIDGCWLTKPLDALHQTIKFMRGSAADMIKEKFKDTPGTGFAIGVEFGSNFMLHFHVLALLPYWDRIELSQMWKEYSLGRGFIVWIEAAGRESADVEKSVGYVTKYVTKPLGKKSAGDSKRGSDKVAQFVAKYGQEPLHAALWYVFKGLRRFQTYGAFYDLELPPEMNEVCSVCGEGLNWVTEFEAIQPDSSWFFLNSLKTNKLIDEGGLSPPKIIQIGLWPNRDDIDFFN